MNAASSKSTIIYAFLKVAQSMETTDKSGMGLSPSCRPITIITRSNLSAASSNVLRGHGRYAGGRRLVLIHCVALLLLPLAALSFIHDDHNE